MPKSLEEAEKRKCEKGSHIFFIGVYFREYKGIVFFYYVTVHIVTMGW